MGFISSISSETKASIAFYSQTVSVINGVPQAEAWSLVTTVEGLFWTGSQNLTFISDKLKTEVDGAIAIDYDSTIAALGDDSKFVVSSQDFRIIHIENVGNQNEMLQILYKRELSN